MGRAKSKGSRSRKETDDVVVIDDTKEGRVTQYVGGIRRDVRTPSLYLRDDEDDGEPPWDVLQFHGGVRPRKPTVTVDELLAVMDDDSTPDLPEEDLTEQYRGMAFQFVNAIPKRDPPKRKRAARRK